MFIYILSLVIFFCVYITLLAEFDLFHKWLITLGIVPFIYLLVKARDIQIKINKVDFPAYGLILIFTLYTSFFFHDNFYGSRDPGIYLNNAVYLAKNHTLKLPTNLNTHIIVDKTLDRNLFTQNYFLIRMEIPHMAWIGAYITFFGYKFINYVFVIPIMLGLLSLYYLFKELSNNKISTLTLILFLTCLPALWWFRSTAVENTAFFFLFSSLYLFSDYFQKKRLFSLIFSIVAFGLYAMVRSEGFINLSIFVCILIYTIKWSGLFANKKRLYLTVSSILIIIFLNLSFIIFYLAKNQVLKTTQELPNLISRFSQFIPSQITTPLPETTQVEAWDSNLAIFVNLILSNYNLYLPCLFIPILFINMLQRIKKDKKTIPVNLKLIFFILLIILPNLYLLYKPQISLDQPWFLRRFYHLIVPLGYFSLTYYLYLFKKRFLTVVSFTIFVVLNIIIASPTLYPNNKGVLEQVNKFSEHIPNNALVLADESSISLYPIAEPLYFVYDKKVVRITKPSDLAYLKPILHAYSNVLFIIDEKSLYEYDKIISKSKLIYKQTFIISRLNQTCELWGYTNQSKDFYYNKCKESGTPHQFLTVYDNILLYSVKDIDKIIMAKY